MSLHVVAMAAIQDGHINPLLQFCRYLVPFGFLVSFITTPEFVDKLSHKLANEDGIKLVPFSEQLFLGHTQQLLDSLQATIEGVGKQVDCFITDAFLGWTQDLANRFGVPRVAQWSSHTTNLVICRAAPLLSSKGYFPVTDKEDNRLVDFLPGLPAIRVRHFPMASRTLPDLGFLLAKQLQRLSEAHSLVLNTVEELEKQVIEAQQPSLRCFAVGPLIPTDTEAQGPGDVCLKWLDTQPASSVLYIAFGSLASLPTQQVEKIANSLEASKLPFLWGFRKNLVAGDPPQDYCEKLAARFSGQGLIVDWTPQAKVLSHSAVGGFLSHCGWNSTLEAMFNGVPLLCWPCVAEQNLNTHLLVDQWKVGLQVTEGVDGDVSQEQMSDLMLALMSGQVGRDMRNKMQHYKELLCEAWKQGGSSRKNLVNFVENLKSSVARNRRGD